MSKKNIVIQVQNIPISVISEKGDDYICLTDMAKAKEGEARAADIIKNWIRTRTTLEFIIKHHITQKTKITLAKLYPKFGSVVT